MFDSIGIETAQRFTEETIREKVGMLSDEEEYGAILRAKGILQDPDGKWFEFDYVPGELQIRPGQPDYTGRMVVIGANVEEAALKALFQA